MLSPAADAVRTIQRDELERELAVNKGLRLVMTLPMWEFEEMHIPASLHFDTSEAMLGALKPNDEVVVYCTNPECLASQRAYGLLVQHGYTNVRRYAGGLEDWSEAGLPLEGRQGQTGMRRPTFTRPSIQ